MPRQLLNEAEQFLLKHWEEARLLEESMEGMRKKYKEVFQRIVEAVTEAHPKLEVNRVWLSQAWANGSVGFGRNTWSIDRNGTPSGLWVDNLRLKVLTNQEADSPLASLWVTKNSDLDFEASKLKVGSMAKQLLTKEELSRTKEGDLADGVLLYVPAPSKTELLTALSEGDGDDFVKVIVSQFNLMARFIPVLDAVFHECLKKQREPDPTDIVQ